MCGRVKNLGVDRKGNIYVLCGNRKEEGRVLWEVDEKGILKEKGRDILLSEEEKFIDIKGVKIERKAHRYSLSGLRPGFLPHIVLAGRRVLPFVSPLYP